VSIPLAAKHRGLAAVPIYQIGSLSVPEALQQKLAVIQAFMILPPAI
jgi:hypothetical protein